MGNTRSTKLVSGGSEINGILNTAVADDSWTAISLAADENCRAICARLRTGNTWKMSDTSAGTNYYTVSGAISINIIKGSGGTLFYVQSSSGSDTLEVILLN